MRKLALAVALVALGVAGPAQARTFAGTLGLSLENLGPVEFAVTASGNSGPGPLASIAAGAFVGTGSIPAAPSSSVVTRFVFEVSNGAGVFTGSPLAGKAPIFGSAHVLGFGGANLIDVPLARTVHAAGSAAAVAAGLGFGGTLSTVVSNGNRYVRLEFGSWGTAPAKLSGLFSVVQMHGAGSNSEPHLVGLGDRSATFTGTDSRTPGGHGQLTLVSPTKVTSDVFGTPVAFVLLGRMTLAFMPEPGTFVLLGTGVAALGALGRRRRLARAAR
jgi:hypothetical protein